METARLLALPKNRKTATAPPKTPTGTQSLLSYEDGGNKVKFDLIFKFDNIKHMPTLDIPKNLIKTEELIVIPKEEYKALLKLRTQRIQEVEMNILQNKALRVARKNLSKSNFLTIGDLKRKLGIAN